jgi:hypothetical protein
LNERRSLRLCAESRPAPGDRSVQNGWPAQGGPRKAARQRVAHRPAHVSGAPAARPPETPSGVNLMCDVSH